MNEALPLRSAGDPPKQLGEMVDWFESLSIGLVLLEPYPLDQLVRAVDAFHARMMDHVRGWEAAATRTPSEDGARTRLRRLVESDHVWFETSFEQLRWFLGVVQNEDHGGHRQALGQYGRLVAEAVRRHLSDERRWAALEGASAKG